MKKFLTNLCLRFSYFCFLVISTSILFIAISAYAQKLQSKDSLSPAEKKYRQYCVKKKECKLYSELRTSFGGVSADDQKLISKIETCNKELDKIGDDLSILLKKEKKIVPLDMCR